VLGAFHAGNSGSNPLGDANFNNMAVRLTDGLFHFVTKVFIRSSIFLTFLSSADNGEIRSVF